LPILIAMVFYTMSSIFSGSKIVPTCEPLFNAEKGRQN
jgi:hypothetical protein